MMRKISKFDDSQSIGSSGRNRNRRPTNIFLDFFKPRPTAHQFRSDQHIEITGIDSYDTRFPRVPSLGHLNADGSYTIDSLKLEAPPRESKLYAGQFFKINDPIAEIRASLTSPAHTGMTRFVIFPSENIEDSEEQLNLITTAITDEEVIQFRALPKKPIYNTLLPSESIVPDETKIKQRPMVWDPKVPTDKDELIIIDNPNIMKFFYVGYEICSAGSGHAWRVHYGRSKIDGSACAVWVFEKKLVKFSRPEKRDEYYLKLRESIYRQNRFKSSRFLHVKHYMEESKTTLAFVSEPIHGILDNLLDQIKYQYLENEKTYTLKPYTQKCSSEKIKDGQSKNRIPEGLALQFSFNELEFGLTQILDAIRFLHDKQGLVHRNVNPLTIIITADGNWKLFSLEFLDSIRNMESVPIPPYSIKLSPILQTNLDYLAPDAQTNGRFTKRHDIYSFVMTSIACFNNGHPMIQAHNDPMFFLKLVKNINNKIIAMLPHVPPKLRDITQKMLTEDFSTNITSVEPYANYLQLGNGRFDTDHALIVMTVVEYHKKLPINIKQIFYRKYLVKNIKDIPENVLWSKLWPVIISELNDPKISESVCYGILAIANNLNPKQYQKYVAPLLKSLFMDYKRLHNYLPLIEHIDIMLLKGKLATIQFLLNRFYKFFIHKDVNVQVSAIKGVEKLNNGILTDYAMSVNVLPQIKKMLMGKAGITLETIEQTLTFFEKFILKAASENIQEQVIPAIAAVHFVNSNVLLRVIELYKLVLSDRKYKTTGNIIASKILPSLMMQTVNAELSDGDYLLLKSVITQLLEVIDQREPGVVTYVLDSNLPEDTPQSPLDSEETTSKETSIAESTANRNKFGRGPADDVDQNAKAGPSGTLRKTYRVVDPSDIDQDAKAGPSGTLRKTYRVVDPSDIDQDAKAGPSGTLRKTYRVVDPSDIDQDAKAGPSGTLRKTYRVVDPSDIDQDAKAGPSGTLRKTYRVVDPSDIDQDAKAGPSGTLRKTYRVVDPSDIDQGAKAGPSGTLRKTYRVVDPSDIDQDAKAGPSGTLRKTYRVADPSDIDQDAKAGPSGTLRKTYRVVDPSDIDQDAKAGPSGTLRKTYRVLDPSDIDLPPALPPRLVPRATGMSRTIPVQRLDGTTGYSPRPTVTPAHNARKLPAIPPAFRGPRIPPPIGDKPVPFFIPRTRSGSTITETTAPASTSGESAEPQGPTAYLKNTWMVQRMISSTNTASSAVESLLRVTNFLPGRRLSDNTPAAPRIEIARSSASSPGGSPVSSAHTRRHSSIGLQERGTSGATHLLPPTFQKVRRP